MTAAGGQRPASGSATPATATGPQTLSSRRASTTTSTAQSCCGTSGLRATDPPPASSRAARSSDCPSTAELALALVVSGDPDRARQLLADVQHLREPDGSYWTGLVFDEGVRWPVERSSWTSAAIVLAADALAGGRTLALFAGDDLPTGALLSADVCGTEGAPCGDTVHS